MGLLRRSDEITSLLPWYLVTMVLLPWHFKQWEVFFYLNLSLQIENTLFYLACEGVGVWCVCGCVWYVCEYVCGCVGCECGV